METKTIRETLRYVHRYRSAKIAIKIDDTIANQGNMEGITEDITLMKTLGMNVEIINSRQGETPRQPIDSQDTEEKITSEDELTARMAVKSGADKLIYLTGRDGIFIEEKLIREISVIEAEKLLFVHDAVRGKMREKVKGAILACRNGVSRVHIISGLREGILLQEIFSCQGMGTMIFREPTYQNIRQGKKEDITGISEILAANNFYLPLSEISKKISDFFVFVIDEVVYGCVSVERCYDKNIALEASHLSTCSDYEEESIEQKLLEYLIDMAGRTGTKYIFLETGKNPVWIGLYPWFLKMGFQKHHSKDLSWTKKNRTAEVWVKTL